MAAPVSGPVRCSNRRCARSACTVRPLLPHTPTAGLVLILRPASPTAFESVAGRPMANIVPLSLRVEGCVDRRAKRRRSRNPRPFATPGPMRRSASLFNSEGLPAASLSPGGISPSVDENKYGNGDRRLLRWTQIGTLTQMVKCYACGSAAASALFARSTVPIPLFRLNQNEQDPHDDHPARGSRDFPFRRGNRPPSLEEGFRRSAAFRPSRKRGWHWMNGSISKEGIRADLWGPCSGVGHRRGASLRCRYQAATPAPCDMARMSGSRMAAIRDQDRRRSPGSMCGAAKLPRLVHDGRAVGESGGLDEADRLERTGDRRRPSRFQGHRCRNRRPN